MESILSEDYMWLWAAALAVALFFPARRLIWMMSVNRAARKLGKPDIGEEERQRLRKRAGITAALACYIIALLYTWTLFKV